MLFLGSKETLPAIEFNPRNIPTTGQIFKGKDISDIKTKDKESKILLREFKGYNFFKVIIFVGPPGAGKSTLWRNHFSDYVRVNNVIGGKMIFKLIRQ